MLNLNLVNKLTNIAFRNTSTDLIILTEFMFYTEAGRALYRYRRGHGFESRSGLNLFQALISQLVKLCVSLR